MVDALEVVGIVSMVIGAWSGFLLLIAVDRPQLLRSVGVVDPSRIRQLHLDWIIMGVLMTVIAAVVPGQSTLGATLVMAGGIVNPLTFIPMAFSKTVVERKWFQAVSMLSFLALCCGLTGALVSHLGA